MADQMVNELRLEYLPPEILSEIGRCMPLEDLKKMSMTSKKMRRSFSRWLFHSVAVRGDADEVIYQIEYMLPSVNTEMRQMMMANVNSLCTVDSTASDSTQKIMNRLVNKFARNRIKSLTLNDDRGNNLLEIAKTECPDLRRLILRKNYPKIHQPPPSEILEAVGKDISKAFPELEWFVIDYKWEPRSEEDAAVELKMASQALAPGEDHEEEDYFHRDFESGIAHIAQIAPKLKEICFTTFNMWAYDTCVDGTRYEYSLIYRGVRNTESAKMSLERPLAPGRHGFPRGLIF
ncbi:hypothetical protein FGSG_01707 [Fusarium graminearum PH-1]|uniref:Chromosome 1, complete genome n=1 Tax=Gibberella zeae (strain ATCC MYA-4620 / CBS 123657 / FGSC 9075 / NRRL 31084 / PH-1) TaxID=229533 RepID=I1RDK5_GIBZE|nr:hypothetical protein FGSG_01707 [Fusarium graminearum PH-1]ESU07053.1 hypothetical protein FGSG_01707 [Fusarium graminearum PH-1]CEF73884.1 unnamed protein product [Fusarium graminearum]|eukprot:XP_011317538.1 hypothetical protein FGSG_01707 [Fusarium graminearum PH-1]